MVEVKNISIYEYPDEVLIELTRTDEFGEIAVTTYQFAYTGESQELIPEQTIEQAHLPQVKEVLGRNGYRLGSITRDVA